MALTDKINDGFKQLATLLKGKVDKTATIAVANGGTGATGASQALTNLGAMSTAYANANSLTDANNIPSGGISLSYLNRNIPNSPNSSIDYAVLNLQILGGWGAEIAYSPFGAKTYIRYHQSTPTWTQWGQVVDTVASTTIDLQLKSITSGAAGYKKGWRKLTATLPSQADEITKAHGVTTVETVQAKVTNSDGIIIYNNDIDPTNQFYVRVNGANLILGVTANSTKVFGKTVTIYVGEEL